MKGTKNNNKDEERKNILWLTIADKPASSRSDLAKYVKKIAIFKLKALDQKITNLLTQLKKEGKIVNVGKGRKGARYSTLQKVKRTNPVTGAARKKVKTIAVPYSEKQYEPKRREPKPPFCRETYTVTLQTR